MDNFSNAIDENERPKRGKGMKRKNGTNKKDQDEINLEQLIFGGMAADLEPTEMEVEEQKEIELKDVADEELFFIDDDEETEKLDAIKAKEVEEKEAENPLWQDDDDEEIVNISTNNRLKKLRKNFEEEEVTGTDLQTRLKTQHLKLGNVANWAEIKEQDEIDEAFRQVDGIIDSDLTDTKLTPENFLYEPCAKINLKDNYKGPVKHLEFHPEGEVILSSGPKDPIYIHRVDTKKSSLLRTIIPSNYPVTGAAFFDQGRQILATVGKTIYYSIDTETGDVTELMLNRSSYAVNDLDLGVVVSPQSNYFALLCSKDSTVNLMSGKTRMGLGYVTLPTGKPVAAQFSNDEKLLYTLASNADVFVWDSRTRRCLHKFKDFGGFQSSSMKLMDDGKHLVIGSNSGVVNVYNIEDVLASYEPKPIKEIFNLTTPVDTLASNFDSQLLGLASSEKRNSIRLLHMSSLKVIPNFLPLNFPGGYVSSMSFAPKSRFLAFGNNGGQIPLFRLRNYN